MNLDIETIRAHIADRIDASALKMKPFPYLVIEEFFPKEIFDMLLEHNPFSHDEGKEWISKKAQLLTKNKTPYHLRNQINFYENQEFDSEETKKLWETIQRVFLEDYWFVELIHKKFPEYFDIRFGNFFKKSNYKHFESQMFLQRHQESYSIGPHTDIANRIFTCIFALASETGYEQYGTEILEPLESNESCWGDYHHDKDKFRVVDVAPYKPNNFLLFFKTRHSFHAVPEITPDIPNGRYGMQFQFYEPDGGVFKDLSRDNLYTTQHDTFIGKCAKVAKKIKKLAS